MTEQMRHDAIACGAMRACLDSRHMQSYLSIEGLESKKRDPMGQGQYAEQIQSQSLGACPKMGKGENDRKPGVGKLKRFHWRDSKKPEGGKQ
jgi:hypothetical protein